MHRIASVGHSGAAAAGHTVTLGHSEAADRTAVADHTALALKAAGDMVAEQSSVEPEPERHSQVDKPAGLA